MLDGRAGARAETSIMFAALPWKSEDQPFAALAGVGLGLDVAPLEAFGGPAGALAGPAGVLGALAGERGPRYFTASARFRLGLR
jgi:hypothetical protein